ILGIMNKIIATPKSQISPFAPRILTMKVDPDKIGLIIGPGGKNIKGISEETGAKINIDNDGTVTIYSKKAENAEIAEAMAALSPDDRKAAEAQRFCAVSTGSPLGSMGTPVKLEIKGEPVFLCCAGCKSAALKNPDEILAAMAKRKTEDSGKAK
ncbi:MAG: KH domain-containing protein, partial [Planctomycetota bacterium]